MEGIVQLTAVIEREGDGYVALCPEMDIASQGDSVEDAKMNLQEALAGFFEAASPDEVRERLHMEVSATQLEVAIMYVERTSRERDVPDAAAPRVSPHI